MRKITNGEKKSLKLTWKTVLMLVALILVTVALFGFYEIMMRTSSLFRFVLPAYMIISALLILIFLLYNRGVSRQGVTPEMLPEEWTEEQKNDFIEDGKRRLRKSRWMIIPIFAFLFTFAVDAMRLYLPDVLANLFGK